MSYQSSIHFDPTALLIIKNELDNSILQVEAAVNTLVEDQTIPFGMDDVLLQFEQCERVVTLIEMPQLAQLFRDCAALMQQIMLNPQQIDLNKVTALSEGTSMLKRYIEFMCLREVKVSQFLLDTFNRLQQALGKPLSKEGFKIEPLLQCFEPKFQLPALASLTPSPASHLLFKHGLHALLARHYSQQDTQALSLAALHMANHTAQQPSALYWQLVAHGLSHADNMLWSDARLRALIQIERNMAAFHQNANFQASHADLADALSLCISQENATAELIRQELDLREDILSDAQLQVMRRHLFGPDHETIHNVSRLMAEMMLAIRNQLEDHYQRATDSQVETMQQQLQALVSLFKVLNLNDVAQDLQQQAEQLQRPDYLHDEHNSHSVLGAIERAFNAMGILERHHRSKRLYLPVNNLQISLDRLDDAHNALLSESKLSLEQVNQKLFAYLQQYERNELEQLDVHFNELAGAALFLGSEPLYHALRTAAQYIQRKSPQPEALPMHEVQALFDVVASIDGLIDNLKNHQPVLQSMFVAAANSSQQLQLAV